MIIILLGYMASGKSYVGKHLAKKLDYDFIDLDDYIEVKENQAITTIFKEKGEIYFRKLESKSLIEILSKTENLVVALGGGTPCYGTNMNILLEASNCKTFYLKASLPTLIERLGPEQDKRPLIAHLKTKEALTEFLGKHLFERTNFYSKSHFTIAVDHKNIETIIEDILFKLF